MRYHNFFDQYFDDDEAPSDLISVTKDWRVLFDPELVKKAENALWQRQVYNIRFSDTYCDASVHSGNKRHYVKIVNVPTHKDDEWTDAVMSCSCADASFRGKYCIHMAAVMSVWEHHHGPWTFKETVREYRKRKEEEELKILLKQKEELYKQYGDRQVPASAFFTHLPPLNGLVFFDIESAVQKCRTTSFATIRAAQIRDRIVDDSEYYKEKDDKLGRSLCFSCTVNDPLQKTTVYGILSGDSIQNLRSIRSNYYYDFDDMAPFDPGSLLDEYQLLVLQKVWEHLAATTAGDQTDGAARSFFDAMDRLSAKVSETALEETKAQKAKDSVLVLSPRIIVENGNASLSFKIGRRGQRLYILKHLGNLVHAYDGEEELSLSKKESIDFARQDFCEESAPMLQFILRRVGEILDVNRQLTSKNFGYYTRVGTLSVSSTIELQGSVLDDFYDAAEGGKCDYQDKTNKISETPIPVGHRNLRIDLKADRLSDARGVFAGIEVSGLIPVMIGGNLSNYILNDKGLSRISAEEKQMLTPFLKVSDLSGYFRFRVGKDNLQEFYYRVLPSLLNNPYVRLEDHLDGEEQQYLPPEPEFTFLIDLEETAITCRANVSYDGKNFQIPESKREASENKEYRDRRQESRVVSRIEKWFPDFNRRSREYLCEASETELYEFLSKGVADLEQYGTVKGTARFSAQKIRPMSSVRVGVSLESGVMDLSVTSKEFSSDELLDILKSYRYKKRYHRLRSGDFVDLSYDGGFSEIEALLDGVDITPEEAIEKGVSLPVYRALYLGKLMEEHESIAANRDRNFRGLLKNFNSIRDADHEIPADLEDTLRPYQAYGFKWLKTLEAAGFGGILADEMGLGKTLQMISVIYADRVSGSAHPSLIICPASLVYNWQEEFARFAPSLSTLVLSGPLSARKELLNNYLDYDVCIISYDTLKRDIVMYKDKYFRHCVLDEAQYVKNPKAAVSKAVKTISADHRFALTGTPIENRLSELWSIFDFLMPGFLYSMDEFTKRFETPIVSKKDEAVTEKLRRMTSPFILRRCKSDVLKDLPAKLEEVRYARLSGRQQQVYDAQVIRLKEMLAQPASSGKDRIKVLAELTRIRQICCDPALLLEDYRGESAKRAAAMELIRSAIDGGHRMLLFSQFTSMLDLLMKDLDHEKIPYYLITGSTPKEKRLTLVHDFNEGDVPIFLISLKAGGTGLNLTGADMVIHYDPWWNLAVQNQATDRAHRIGQTRQVTVYKLVLKDTIEERIVELQEKKKDLADAILTGESESITQLSNEELLALLE